MTGAFALLAGCAHLEPSNSLFQVSTIDALLAGVYDGEYPVSALNRHGDLGLGTFNALDGEMVVLDGAVYQVRSDGIIRRVGKEARTPFATVVTFHPDLQLTLRGLTDFPSFMQRVDKSLPSPNLYYAFRATGTFESVKTRSVPRQEKPYRRLAQVVAGQSVFEATRVRGTLIGFRCPDFTAGINVPGYHLHFLSDDRSFGGHVLAFTCHDLNVSIDRIENIHMFLPGDREFLEVDLSKHKAEELNRVEK